MLADEFANVDEFKKFVVALTFKTLKAQGMDTDKAFDTVFGDGSYDELFEEVWNQKG